MGNLNNYKILENYSLVSENIISENKDKKDSLLLRAYFTVSLLTVGGVSISSTHNQHFNLDVVEPAVQTISLKNSEKISEGVSRYINEITNVGIDVSKYSLIGKIISFKSLENSWDGFGAIPLGVKCATNAIKLLDNFNPNMLSKISDIFPNPNGTITIEWENNISEIISLEVGQETFTYYVDFKSLEPKFFNKQSFSVENIKLLKKYISEV